MDVLAVAVATDDATYINCNFFHCGPKMFEIIIFNKFLVSIVFVCSTSSFSHSAWFDSVLVWLSVATASTMCFLLFIDLFPIKHTHTHTERDYYCCCGCCFFLHPFHAGLLLKNILRE